MFDTDGNDGATLVEGDRLQPPQAKTCLASISSSEVVKIQSQYPREPNPGILQQVSHHLPGAGHRCHRQPHHPQDGQASQLNLQVHTSTQATILCKLMENHSSLSWVRSTPPSPGDLCVSNSLAWLSLSSVLTYLLGPTSMLKMMSTPGWRRAPSTLGIPVLYSPHPPPSWPWVPWTPGHPEVCEGPHRHYHLTRG